MELRSLLILMIIVVLLPSFDSKAGEDVWIKSNGPYGGEINSFAISPTGDIYAGVSNRGGLYRSTNNGDSWTQTSLAFNWVSALGVNSSGHIFAGSGGVKISYNNGDTWKQSLSGVSVLSIFISTSDVVFAGTSNGQIWRYINEGSGWEKVFNLNNSLANVRAIAINSSGHVFATVDFSGIYRSTSNGDPGSWQKVLSRSTGFWALAINANNNIFAGYNGGVLCSTDGTNWYECGNLGVRIFSIVVDSNGYLFAGSEGSGIWCSTTNGGSWYPCGLDAGSVGALAVNSANHVYAGTRYGVYRNKFDGNSWQWTSDGIRNTHVRAIAANSQNHLFAGTDEIGVYGLIGDVYRSTNGGNSWERTNFPDKAVGAIAVDSNDVVFVAAGSIYRSIDNGDNWERLSNYTGQSAKALAISSKNYIFAGTFGPWGEFWLSKDGGDTWDKCSSQSSKFVYSLAASSTGYIFAGLLNGGVARSTEEYCYWTRVGLDNLSVRALAVNSNGEIFAGIVGPSCDSSTVWRSPDDGDNWYPTGLMGACAYALAINPRNNHIFAGTADGIYRSKDNGDTWTLFNTGMSSAKVRSFTIDSLGYIFAGTEYDGIYQSQTSTPVAVKSYSVEGVSEGILLFWEVIGQTGNEIFHIYRAPTEHDDYICITPAMGVKINTKGIASYLDKTVESDRRYYYRLRIQGGDGDLQFYLGSAVRPQIQLALHQNYPNPFNPITTISFSLPARVHANLSIYNIEGKLIRTLENKLLGEGFREYLWDGTDTQGNPVASGVYFYRLRVGGMVLTKKMILLK